MKFASWNVNYLSGSKRTKGLVSLIKEVNADVLALQEVNPPFHAELAEALRGQWSASSLSLWRTHRGEGDDGRLNRGCSIFGNPVFPLARVEILHDTLFPSQTLVAAVRTVEGDITVCSFHAPPGSNKKTGNKKGIFLHQIAERLRTHNQRAAFGMDANTPRMDHPDITKTEFWREGECDLLGPKPLHNLRDTLRTYLNERPSELSRIRRQRPNGPLAVSYVRRGQNGKSRYDFIYATADVHVQKVEYLYDKAVSDHAMVVADLEFSGTSVR